jgi:hypothetical protein
VVPEKVSLVGVDLKIANPLTPSGTPSTSLTSIATSALRFTKVLCPVLVYALLAFWLSVYRDHEAAKYLRELAVSGLRRAANQQYTATQEHVKEVKSVLERFQSLTAKRHEAIEVLQRKSGEIGDEFARIMRPVQQDHAAATAELRGLEMKPLHATQNLRAKCWD